MRCKQFITVSLAGVVLAASLAGCGGTAAPASSVAASSEAASSVVASSSVAETALPQMAVAIAGDENEDGLSLIHI